MTDNQKAVSALPLPCGGLCVLPAGHRSGCYSPVYIRDSIDAEAEYEILCRVVAENKWGGYPKWAREQFVATVPTGQGSSDD